MTCKAVLEFLDDYEADRLDRLTRLRFQYHLSICHHCRRYLDSYRKTIALAEDAFHAPPDTDSPAATLQAVPEDLVQAILRSRARE